MKKTTLALLSTLLVSAITCGYAFCNEQIALDGTWQFQLDRNDEGVRSGWFSKNLSESIQLPGSMAENLKGDIPGLKTQWTGSLYDSSFYYNPSFAKYRQEGKVKFPFFLTPDRHYIGVAWYRKEVVIPKNWNGSRITLFLERSHTITRVWVDNKELGKDSTYCVPQVFDLTTALKPGKHTITLRIDNRIGLVNVGPDSHSVSDQTQGNWNGVVGKMLLQSGAKIYFDDVQVYPNLTEKKARIKVQFENTTGKAFKGNLRYRAKSFNTANVHETSLLEQPVNLPKGLSTLELSLPMGDKIQTWSEFNPALYKLDIELIAPNKTVDTKTLTFGMREITIQGKWFYVNGRKTQLRGTVENCDFPMTGYAPMDVASWERVFRIAKRYGLNHMRFHSYCPPDAAFEAADLVGFYLQPEGPSWPNHGSSLGDGKPIDQFLMDETIRMSKVYGNHASFTMMAAGNEPRGRWVRWVTKFVNYWKKTDNRRVYTGASVGGGWEWQPGNQYHVKAGARGLDWDRNMPESNSDFGSKIDTVSVPFVSHETGQWCVFPNFAEIRKYTGVNKARNMELFQEDLADHDMGGMGHDFMMASGKLQVLAYKHDIEKNLRTPDYAGFELLSLNDYSGQGTALVGVLDVFWDEKGYCIDRDFRQFCGPVVPLIRTSKFVWQSDEHFTAKAELSYFGASEKQVIKPTWVLKNALGVVVAEGMLNEQSVETGLNIPLGTIDIDLSFVQKAGRYSLEVATNTCEGLNSWNLYIYPAVASNVDVSTLVGNNDIYVANKWDDLVASRLAMGKDVLILGAGKITYGREVVQTLAPIFWNTSWFKMRPPHTTGILVNPNHPIFKDFPTESYADLQWWEIINRAQVMQFTDFPKGFQPLIQSIDTWFVNRKIGMLFEAKVGQGRLIVCSADLQDNLKTRPVARQLLISIINYMNSNKFRPEFTVDAARVSDLFSKVAGGVNMFTKDSPDELKPKLNATQNK
ncbi:MAG TPA: beta-glucuronidase [Bacteroidales bacterium]|nr:beta-glucuronidase [Bacteroidales bacterium]